jgi:sigma-B regulation protein RsbU (phosphoserine phosphatase)
MVVKKITAHGMFLGVFDEVEYEEGEFKMEKGDIAFMYTDGLNEAMNKSDEQYGYDRLISKIIMFHQEKCSDIIKYIMDDVKEFTEGRPFADDITIFVIKKEE